MINEMGPWLVGGELEVLGPVTYADGLDECRAVLGGIRAPRNCFWGPSDILYTNSIQNIFLGPQVTFMSERTVFVIFVVNKSTVYRRGFKNPDNNTKKAYKFARCSSLCCAGVVSGACSQERR
jgi:hypothetical protein